jgi:hypothetical protein
MYRRFTPAALAIMLVLGCAGPSKLAKQSEEKLAGGRNGQAWRLATRALDKDPGNARARAAATAAGNAIARDWEQRIGVLAQSDSLAAAEQVLELSSFRVGGIRYAAISVSPEWSRAEQALRHTAARTHYQRGVADLGSQRPKRAWFHFADVQRFVPDYREVARLSDRASEKAMTRVAFVPLAAASGTEELGRDVAAAWRDDLAQRLVPPNARFTRVLGSAAVEQQMRLSQLGRMSREDAVRLGRKAGAERVVWGSIGGVDAQTRLHLFTDVVARRIVEKRPDGQEVARWVAVPLEVISRVRTVTVDVDYEIIATRGGGTLAHQRERRSTSARVVWTLFSPDGDLDSYALVADDVRTSEPARFKQVESRWKEACGESTTLRQVLEARRSSRGSGHYDRTALPRFMAGAAFVFLQELPPADDLAFAALAGCGPLRDDLLRLDQTDDVDLGMAVEGSDGR